MRRRQDKGERGSAMVEFAVASTLLMACLTGTWQFGYSFYIYNQLQVAIANGGQYACLKTYRSASTSDVNKGKAEVRNMVVYGAPNPANNATAIVRGLQTSNVDVDYTVDANGVPESVRVQINSFSVDAMFKTFTFTGKPTVTFPFLGRYAPNEAE